MLKAGSTISLVVTSLNLAFPSAQAAESDTSTPMEWNNTWSSANSRALGGSQTAHASNEDALYANPASLSKTRHPRSRKAIDSMEFPGLSVGGNRATLSALKGKTLQPSQWLKSIGTQNTNERSYAEVQALPWLVAGERGGPSYFFGLPVRSILIANPSTDGGISRTVISETTAGAALNLSVSSRTGSAALGLSLRPNVRWNSVASYTLADVSSSKGFLSAIKSESQRTTSMAMDLGVLLSARDFWLPAFGLSVLNLPTACVESFINPATGKRQSICGAKRTGSVDSQIQGTALDPTEIRAGVSITPRVRLGRARINLKISGDLYPIPIQIGGRNYGYTDVNINQLAHAGIELFLGSALNSQAIAVKAGINDTRVSWGLSLPMPHFNVEMSSFEAAVFNSGKAIKERRYLLGLSSDW